MKIAVASNDGMSISSHFGRSACWLVFEALEGQIVGVETRSNHHTAHARGECDGAHDRNLAHGHEAIVAALGDCEAVLCAGMGWRAAEELTRNRITPFVVERDASPEEAVRRYLAGELPRADEGFCRCHHA